MRHFLLLLFCFYSILAKSEKNNFCISENEKISIETSNNYVSNEDYITFLIWNIKVFYPDYPDRVVSLLPGKNLNDDTDYNSSTFPLKQYLNNSESFVKDYLFNSNFRKYPVIGINNFQISEFCKWLSDRENESALITEQVLKKNFDQIDEDCFVTESYTSDMYYGGRIVHETIADSSKIFKTNYILPIKNLVENCEHKIKKLESQHEQFLFLKLWKDLYFLPDFEIGYHFTKECYFITENELIIQNPSKRINPKTFKAKELYISDSNSTAIDSLFNNLKNNLKPSEFFKVDNYHLEKNEFGQMGFVHFTRNNKGEMLCIDLKKYSALFPITEKQNFYFKVMRFSEIN